MATQPAPRQRKLRKNRSFACPIPRRPCGAAHSAARGGFAHPVARTAPRAQYANIPEPPAGEAVNLGHIDPQRPLFFGPVRITIGADENSVCNDPNIPDGTETSRAITNALVPNDPSPHRPIAAIVARVPACQPGATWPPGIAHHAKRDTDCAAADGA